MLNILWRNMKWRYQNPLSVIFTIVQPLIWLLLYSAVASQSMTGITDQNYISFLFPGIMILVTLACSCSGGYLNFIMKSKGSFYRILIAPVKRHAIVLGQIFEAIILAFIEIGLLSILCLFFSVKIKTGFCGLLLIMVLIFLSAFFVSSIAYTISLLLPNEIIYETIMNSIVLPIFFLSTALFPLDSLKGPLKTVVFLNPFTHVINSIRSLINGETILFNEGLPTILLLILLSIIGFLLALWRLKKETAH